MAMVFLLTALKSCWNCSFSSASKRHEIASRHYHASLPQSLRNGVDCISPAIPEAPVIVNDPAGVRETD
jgi:hypothetical protein